MLDGRGKHATRAKVVIALFITALFYPCRGLRMGGNNMMLLQQPQSQPIPSALLRGAEGMTGSSPGHSVGGPKITVQGEAFAAMIIGYENKRLYAPGLQKAPDSTTKTKTSLPASEFIPPANADQVANAEEVTTEHPPPGYFVPVQASVDDVEPLTTENKGVELVQESSGGRGGADLKTAMTTVAEFEFDGGNGGMFAAPLAGGNAVDPAKTSEEKEAFLMVEQQQQQQRQHQTPGWMKAFMNFFNKLSGRKLLLMAKTSAQGLIDRGPTIKGLDELFADFTDTTATLAVGLFSLRLGGKTPALLATLVTGVAARSLVSAALTSADVSDNVSSGPSDPGDLTDGATLAIFGWVLNIAWATVLLRILGLSALFVLAKLAVWARSMSKSRRSGSSGSPNNQAAGAAAVPAVPAMPADAPAMPPAAPAIHALAAAAPPAAAPAMPPAAPAMPPTANAMIPAAAAMPPAAPAIPAGAAVMPAAAAAAAAAPAVPPAAPVMPPAPPAMPVAAPVPVAPPATPAAPPAAPAMPAQPMPNAPAAAGPEPPRRVGRLSRVLQRAVPFCNCVAASTTHASAVPPAPASSGSAQSVPNPTAPPEPQPRGRRGRRLLQCLRAMLLCSSIAANAAEWMEDED